MMYRANAQLSKTSSHDDFPLRNNNLGVYKPLYIPILTISNSPYYQFSSLSHSTSTTTYSFALRRTQAIFHFTFEMAKGKSTKRNSRGECVIAVFGSVLTGAVHVKVNPLACIPLTRVRWRCDWGLLRLKQHFVVSLSSKHLIQNT